MKRMKTTKPRKTNIKAARSLAKKRPDRGEAKIYQITFCDRCGEAIPAKAITCYRCNAKQAGAEEALQVVFCERCGKDYPARGMTCLHCGHLNPRHPYLTGRISS